MYRHFLFVFIEHKLDKHVRFVQGPKGLIAHEYGCYHECVQFFGNCFHVYEIKANGKL